MVFKLMNDWKPIYKGIPILDNIGKVLLWRKHPPYDGTSKTGEIEFGYIDYEYAGHPHYAYTFYKEVDSKGPFE